MTSDKNKLTEFYSEINFNNSRPNIVWLDAEDMCPDLGCYGLTQVYTPNLDQLAQEGIRYKNAFTTAPVCSPSRCAFITGKYQTSTGTHHHRSNRNLPLADDLKLIPEYFQEAGYFVINGQVISGNKGKLDYNFSNGFEEIFDGTHWNQREQNQPFFAEIHFAEAHRSFSTDPDNPINPDEVDLPAYLPNDEVTRKKWAQYLETIQILDKKVGKVLQALKNDGLSENTIIIFTGDHGRAHVRGKQWLYDAGIQIPLIIRWPDKIKPGQVEDKLVSMMDIGPTMLNLAGIDYSEELEGKPFLGPGANNRNYIFAARDRCDETIEFIRCVRTKRYKYICNYMPYRSYLQPSRYKDGSYPTRQILRDYKKKNLLTPQQTPFTNEEKPFEELYDLEQDPEEVNNLADSPSHQEKLNELRSVLEDWIKETGDLGFLPEPELYKLLKKYNSADKIRKIKNYDKLLPQLIKVIKTGAQGKKGVNKLLKKITHDNPSIRYWAIRGLINYGFVNEQIKEKLREVLKEDKDWIRAAAAGTLCRLGDEKEGLPALFESLKSDNKIVRHYALSDLEALGEIVFEKIENIAEYENDDYKNVRRIVKRLLKKNQEME